MTMCFINLDRNWWLWTRSYS